MSTDSSDTNPTGGVTVTDSTDVTETVAVHEETSYVIFRGSGIQGPPGAEVELRRQGTSSVIEWRHEDDDAWQDLIDLADGVVHIKPIPPELKIGSVTVVDDPADADVNVTQADPMEANYVFDFHIPRGATGLPGKNGQPRFAGHGTPDLALFPDAVDNDVYLDVDNGKLWIFHPDSAPTPAPDPGTTPDPGAGSSGSSSGTGSTTPTTGGDTTGGTTGDGTADSGTSSADASSGA